MKTAWCHLQPQTEVYPRGLVLSDNHIPQPDKGLDGFINCIFCGSITDDFEAVDYWPLPMSAFRKAHRSTIHWMDRNVGIPGPEQCKLSGELSDRESSLHICGKCGWWVAVDKAIFSSIKTQLWYITLVSSPVLKELDLKDLRIPIEEVRRYLMRRYEMRYSLHPRIFEETVASVFRDLGYDAKVTAYTKDGGIDVILTDSECHEIGVQVKRYRQSIQVEQIRSFLGALTLEGYTRGIFISTSKFQSGAKRAAAMSTNRHIPIELVDAKRFLEMLRVAQPSGIPDPDSCGFDRERPLHWSLYSDLHLNSL